MPHWIDLAILILALGAVAVVSILASRGERTRDDYFLAGRHPVELPNRPVIDMTPWRGVKPLGVAI